jgi:hypothetical protein
MPFTVIDLPYATRKRLYRLAARRHQRIDRVVSDLIDAASLELTIAEWEDAWAEDPETSLSDEDRSTSPSVIRARQRFADRLRRVQEEQQR